MQATIDPSATTGAIGVGADAKLTHVAEVKLPHLGNDGGLFAANVDPGASSGDSGIGSARPSIHEIARQMCCSRNTVRRYLGAMGASAMVARVELFSPRRNGR